MSVLVLGVPSNEEEASPPEKSNERTSHGTLDLLAALFDAFRYIVGGAWSVLFPADQSNLVTDAAAQFWVACLYNSRPEDMKNGFVGHLCQHRDEHFGNARLVRNCFESTINAQANRLAACGTVAAEALARLEAADLDSPAEAARGEFRQQGRTYTVTCEHCGQVYSWLPELNLREGDCSKCGKHYDAEFGMLEGESPT